MKYLYFQRLRAPRTHVNSERRRLNKRAVQNLKLSNRNSGTDK
jgi:hypothetical protein